MSEVLSSNVRGGAVAYVSGAHRYPLPYSAWISSKNP